MTNHHPSLLLTKLLTLATFLTIPTPTLAHGYVQGIVATPPSSSPVWYPGYLPSYQWMTSAPSTPGWADPKNDNNGPITPANYASPDIICHVAATPGTSSIPVVPGTNLTLQWTNWPTGHLGPVITYIAPCNGPCTTVDKSTLRFTKIDEAGLLTPGMPGTWAAQELVANNNSWTVTIPTNIADGEYVVRHEIIALQEAMREDGAQNYPQCINVKVSGGGLVARADVADESAGVLGTELYGTKDPGILIDIYNQVNNDYIIPGPKMKALGAGSGSPVASAATVSVTADSVHVAAVTPAAEGNTTVVSGKILSNETIAVTVTTATSIEGPIEFAVTMEDTTVAFTVASANQTVAPTVVAAGVTTTSAASTLKFGVGVEETTVALTVASANGTAMAKMLSATATSTGASGEIMSGTLAAHVAAVAETSSVAAILANETTAATTTDVALVDTSVLPTIVAEASIDSSTQAQYGTTSAAVVEGTMYAYTSAMTTGSNVAIQDCAADVTTFVTVIVTAGAVMVEEVTETLTSTKEPMPTLSAGLPDSASVELNAVDTGTHAPMPTLSAGLPSTFQTVTSTGMVEVINHAPVGLSTEPFSYISPAATPTTTQPGVFAIAAANDTIALNATSTSALLAATDAATTTPLLEAAVSDPTTAIQAIVLPTSDLRDITAAAATVITPPAPLATPGVFNIDIDAVITLTTIINSGRQLYALDNETALATATAAATGVAAVGTGDVQRLAAATPTSGGGYKILATGATGTGSAGVAAETGIVTADGFVGVTVPEIDNGFRKRSKGRRGRRGAERGRRARRV